MDVPKFQVESNIPNIFSAFLTEHYTKPTTNLVEEKRKRFANILRMMVCSYDQGNYTKCWVIVKYLKECVQKDDYPDEFTHVTVHDLLTYLNMYYISCCIECTYNLEECIEICKSHIKEYDYPMLYSILATCYLKLHKPLEAEETILEGFDFITMEFKKFSFQKFKKEDFIWKLQNSYVNSPSYNLMLLFSYSMLLRLDSVGIMVTKFVEKTDMNETCKMIKSLMNDNISLCCYGTGVKNVLMKYISLRNQQEMNHLNEGQSEQRMHISNHCSAYCVFINNYRVNHQIFVSHFNLVAKSFFTKQCIQTFASYKISSPSFDFRRKLVKVRWIIGKPFKPYSCATKQCIHFSQQFRKLRLNIRKYIRDELSLNPLRPIIDNLRVKIVTEIYQKIIDENLNACQVINGMEHTVLRLMYIDNKVSKPLYFSSYQIYAHVDILLSNAHICFVEMRGYIDHMRKHINSLHLTEIHQNIMNQFDKFAASIRAKRIELIRFICCHLKPIWNKHFMRRCNQYRRNLFSIKIFLDDYLKTESKPYECYPCFFASAEFIWCRRVISPYLLKCDFQHRNGQTNAKRLLNKETQTNYSKYFCVPKQIQTDKKLSEEHALKMEMNALQAELKKGKERISGLEEKINISKKVIVGNDKTIKSLKREFNALGVKNIEKNREVEELKDQIKQLKINLSNLHKSYSHAVRTPDKEQKDKQMLEQIEILQSTNASLIVENNRLNKHLEEITEEYDQIKAKRDVLIDYNIELSARCDQKDKQHELLVVKLKNLKTATAEKFNNEQTKVIAATNAIYKNLKELVDTMLDTLLNYKLRGQAVYQEICYLSNYNLSIELRQFNEANRQFLVVTNEHLENKIGQLLNFLGTIVNDSATTTFLLPTSINYKALFSCSEDLCSAYFNQYIDCLKSFIILHGVEITLNNNTTGLFNQASMCPPFYPINDQCNLNPRNQNMQPKTVPVTSPKFAPGPVGANRPQKIAIEYEKAKTQSSIEIEDANTKNILSQISNAINYPSSMSPTFYKLDATQGAIKRPTPITQRIPTTPESSPLRSAPASASVAGDCTDLTKCDEKYRHIYARVLKRFPKASVSDIMGALDFILYLEYDLNQLAFENIIHNVSNYLDNKAREGSRNPRTEVDMADTIPSDNDTNYTCSICFEDLSVQSVSTLKCSHVFHTKCIKKWLKLNNICPICRQFTLLE